MHPSTTESPPLPRARLLPLVVGAVVLAALLPSVAMAVIAGGLRIAKVDDRPYLVATTLDADRQALAGLRAAGFRCSVAADGPRVVAVMDGPRPHDVSLVLQRPDDARLDRTVPWADTGAPLVASPGRAGRWHARLDGTVDGRRVRLCDTTLELGD